LATVAGVTCGTGTADVTRRFGAGRGGGDEREDSLSCSSLPFSPRLSISLFKQLSFSRGMDSNSVVHVVCYPF
jgi:hypothetical protein